MGEECSMHAHITCWKWESWWQSCLSFYYHLFILKNFRSSLSLKFFFSSHDHCWCNQSLWTFSLAGMMILTWRIMEINGRLVHFFATWDHGAKTLQVSHWTDNNDWIFTQTIIILIEEFLTLNSYTHSLWFYINISINTFFLFKLSLTVS